MPPRLRRLAEAEVVAALARLGFEQVSCRGSHAKLQRVRDGRRQTLTVPLHRDLDTGTLRAIYRQALRFVAEEELRPQFFVGD